MHQLILCPSGHMNSSCDRSHKAYVYNQNRCPWQTAEPSILPGMDSPGTPSPYENRKQCTALDVTDAGGNPFHKLCERSGSTSVEMGGLRAGLPDLGTGYEMYLGLDNSCIVQYLAASLASSH